MRTPHAKFILLLLCVIISFQTNAQTINAENMVGIWKVDSLDYDPAIIPKERKQLVETMISAFKQSTLEFTKDGNFNWNCSLEEMQMKHKHWKLNPIIHKVVVSEWNDSRNIMVEFLVKNRGDHFVLIADEEVVVIEFKKIR